MNNLKKVPATEIKFWNEGKQETGKAIRYNDAFYELVDGKDKGSLVHINSLRK